MMDESQPEYEVFVDDNYHYMDESSRYSGGVFDSWEQAEAKCRMIVDEFLVANFKEGMAAEDLMRQYKSYGEDPWILSLSDRRFSAWDYAAERCEDLCRKRESE